ncbi:hypothetical protein [Streptomyces sp. NPDC001811]
MALANPSVLPAHRVISSVGHTLGYGGIGADQGSGSSSLNLDHNCKGGTFGYCTQNATFSPTLTLTVIPIGLIGGSNGANNPNNANNANNGNNGNNGNNANGNG